MANQTVKKKISEIDTAELPQRIKGLRKALGITQRQLAEGLSVSQGAVAQWEGGDVIPETKHLSRMAQLGGIDDELRAWLLAAAGVKVPESADDEGQMLRIPLFRDAVAAGSARVIDESEHEWLSVPRNLMQGGKIVALWVKGDSMYPLIMTGHLVFVDIADRDPHKLVEKMVAAREGNGVTIKWLRRDGNLFVLVPQRTSRNNPVRVFKAGDDVGIVGRVVKWIGEPPK